MNDKKFEGQERIERVLPSYEITVVLRLVELVNGLTVEGHFLTFRHFLLGLGP